MLIKATTRLHTYAPALKKVALLMGPSSFAKAETKTM